MAGRLEGKAAIVTGAGSGIGRATGLLFAREGASVTFADIDGAAAESAAAEAGRRAIAAQVDVASEDDTAAMAQATLDAFGTIDVLYANAGVASSGRAADVELAEWDRVIRIHLTGVFLSARAVLPTMVDRGGGSIICQSSVAALVGVPELAAYTAAKGGILALARQLAIDYGRYGVRCNSICPGTVLTPLVAATYRERIDPELAAHSDEEIRLRASRGYPLRRLGELEEVGRLALYLASDDSRWTTGAVHVVDGGLTAASAGHVARADAPAREHA
jgi:NAD(P)-dependent dehydrogenase (short-subunit alcohol dehydrogenase family)